MTKAKRYSAKREAILQVLRGTDTHPTAEWVFQQLKPQFPDLSLGTVYRNLAAFRQDGTLISVGVAVVSFFVGVLAKRFLGVDL